MMHGRPPPRRRPPSHEQITNYFFSFLGDKCARRRCLHTPHPCITSLVAAMKFCCMARTQERASRRKAEPSGNDAAADFAIPRPEARGSDAESLHQALLNPHRSLDSCGVGINFRITENGELEIESLAPTGMVALRGRVRYCTVRGCAKQASRRRH